MIRRVEGNRDAIGARARIKMNRLGDGGFVAVTEAPMKASGGKGGAESESHRKGVAIGLRESADLNPWFPPNEVLKESHCWAAVCVVDRAGRLFAHIRPDGIEPVDAVAPVFPGHRISGAVVNMDWLIGIDDAFNVAEVEAIELGSDDAYGPEELGMPKSGV